jgi:hypothetical protein
MKNKKELKVCLEALKKNPTSFKINEKSQEVIINLLEWILEEPITKWN